MLSANSFICDPIWKCGPNPNTVLRQFFALPFTGKQKDYPLVSHRVGGTSQ